MGEISASIRVFKILIGNLRKIIEEPNNKKYFELLKSRIIEDVQSTWVTDRQTDGQADRQADRQTDTDRHKKGTLGLQIL